MNRVYCLVRSILHRSLAVACSVAFALLSVIVAANPASAATPSRLSVSSAGCLQPPTQVNLATLSDAELTRYGLPRRPSGNSASAVANWEFLLAHAKHHACGMGHTTNKPGSGIMRPASAAPAFQPKNFYNQEDSGNWSGGVATGYGYQRVVGQWTVPHLYTNSLSATMASWVGLGGDPNDGGGYLVQVGIQGRMVAVNGSLQESYYAWIEDTNGSTRYGPYPVTNYDSSFTVNALDSIEAIADSNYTIHNEVYFYIGDITTNSYWGNAFAWPLANGSTTEWIVERGTYLNKYSTGNCPTGASCMAFTDDYVIRNGSAVYLDALPAKSVVMYNGSTELDYPGPIHNSGGAVFFNTYWLHT